MHYKYHKKNNGKLLQKEEKCYIINIHCRMPGMSNSDFVQKNHRLRINVLFPEKSLNENNVQLKGFKNSERNVLEDFKMCVKLKELNGLSPDDILNTYWTAERNKYPIDISEILFRMNIRVLPYDFSKYDQYDGEKILGAVVADESNLALLYRKGESKNRNRFTLAHEIAHCCLAHLEEETMPFVEYRHDGVIVDNKEYKANIFAGELLIPLRELRKFLDNEYPNSIPFSSHLAEIFAVSINVMEERLKHLKIPYIDRFGQKIICLE